MLALAVWQGVMVVALVLGSAQWAVPLSLLHVAVAGLAVLALTSRAAFVAALAAGYGVWLLDYLAARSIDDAVTLAACWLGNLLYGIGALTLDGWARWVVPIGGSAVVASLLLALDPTWTTETASAIVVTAAAIVVAGRLGLPTLWRLADDADRAADDLARERGERAAARRASLEAAEDSRLVHDTVINTLGAVASGGRATADRAAVRERCRRDLEVLTGLLRGRRAERGASLLDIVPLGTQVEVRRSGLDDDQVATFEALLPPTALAALAGAVQEAVLNADKHSGADVVHVDVGRDVDALVVTVADDGVGFSPDAVPSRGLRRSVHERMAQVGGSSTVESAPGQGTRVRLRCPLDAVTADVERSVADRSGAAVAEVVDRVMRRATWAWSVGVVGVGVVIELANRPGRWTFTYAMLAVVALCLVLVALDLRRRDRLGPLVETVLVVALPVGFLFSMAGIGFGTEDVLNYQAIGITPVLTLLYVVGRPLALRAALAGLVAVAVALAAGLVGQGAGLTAVALVAVAPALGITAGWRAFGRLVRELVTQAERARDESLLSSVEARAQREISSARRRWSSAGLERSLVILRDLASGDVPPDDQAVREASAQEERHLRQILLLSPTAYRMSAWFARALAEARSREVALVVRSGDGDAPDAATARALGELVLAGVTRSPGRTQVTVGFFPGDHGQRLVMVGPAGSLRVEGVVGVRAHVTHLDDRDVLEAEIAVRA